MLSYDYTYNMNLIASNPLQQIRDDREYYLSEICIDRLSNDSKSDSIFEIPQVLVPGEMILEPDKMLTFERLYKCFPICIRTKGLCVEFICDIIVESIDMVNSELLAYTITYDDNAFICNNNVTKQTVSIDIKIFPTLGNIIGIRATQFQYGDYLRRMMYDKVSRELHIAIEANIDRLP